MQLPACRLACAVVLGNLLVSSVLLPLSSCQHIPDSRHHRFNFANDRRELFFDTHRMSDGREELVYLRNATTESYFFLLEEVRSPLALIVTPCASDITFLLKRKPYPGGRKKSSAETDPFLKNIYKTQLRGKSSPVRLREFKGGGNMVYLTNDAVPGLYTLELTAIKTDTTVKVFGTTTPDSVMLYPQLPPDPSIKLKSKSKRKISFSWNASFEHSNMEYCVSVSRVKNFLSHCSALSHFRGDTVPKPPPNSGFGFSFDKIRNRERAKSSRPIKAVSPGKLYYKCVGSKTSFIFDKAKPGKTYHIDVFVVDKKTNRSSTYKGIVVKTDRRKRRLASLEKRKTITLHKGVRSESVRYVLKSQVKKAVLELKACRGTLPFEILHNNKTIHKSEVRRIQIVRIKNLPAGEYIIRFKGRRKRKRTVSVYFTSNSKYRPPRLPVQHKVKVFRDLTTCTNVTIAWMGNNVKQKYCLYKKEISDKERIRKHRCSNPNNRDKAEKVVCKRFRNRNPAKAVITHTVTGLKPGTLYLFDVYVSQGRSASLVYRNQRARTKTQC